MSPFDFINAINLTKENLFKDLQTDKDYAPFLVNRGLSYFHDTVHQANAMNIHASIPKAWQFQFLLNSIAKKKRFSKWAKKEQSTEQLLLVQEYYGYSSEKAAEALTVLSADQLKLIEEKLKKGGR